MSAHENGRPAFPTLAVLGDKAVSSGGPTLRDYFAAQAMLAFATNPVISRNLTDGASGDDEADQAIARAAFSMADAMLKERAK